MDNQHVRTSVRITEQQRAKLDDLAAQVGLTRNRLVQRLIDVAHVGEVVRREQDVFAVLSGADSNVN